MEQRNATVTEVPAVATTTNLAAASRGRVGLFIFNDSTAVLTTSYSASSPTRSGAEVNMGERTQDETTALLLAQEEEAKRIRGDKVIDLTEYSFEYLLARIKQLEARLKLLEKA